MTQKAPSGKEPRPPVTRLLIASVISGAVALGFELIWLRLLASAFGSESLGLLGVLGGFFAGMVIGAGLLHQVIMRMERPERVYIIAEAIVAVYGLLSPWLFTKLAALLPPLLGPRAGDIHSIGALLSTLLAATVLLLPATAGMGATLAALVESWRRRANEQSQAGIVSLLYAVNTGGATLGIVLAVYLLLPRTGLVAAAVILAILGAVAAFLMWSWSRDNPPIVGPVTDDNAPANANRLSLLLLGLTGAAGIAIEAIATHVLGQVFENTVYTFANILVVYLCATAVGAAIYRAAGGRSQESRHPHAMAALLFAFAISVWLTGFALARSERLLARLTDAHTGFAGHIIAELLVVATVIALPAALMGALFSHLTTGFTKRGIGKAYAINTLGSAIAPFAIVVLLQLGGYTQAFYGVAIIVTILYVGVHLYCRLPKPQLLAAGVAIFLLGLTAPRELAVIPLPPGHHLIDQRVGLHGVVTVSEVNGRQGSERHLRVNRQFRMGGGMSYIEKRMGHIPMLCANNPKHVLFLGLGSAATAGAALHYPNVTITGVELVPEIIDILPLFAAVNNNLTSHSQVSLTAADARRFIRAKQAHYDVIVADLYHPARDGAGSLYTVEHFAAVRNRLSNDGLFVQWLPVYQLSERDLKTIIRTFLHVFPEAHSVLGGYNAAMPALGLLAWRGNTNTGVNLNRLHQSFHQVEGASQAFQNMADFLSSYMLDSDGLNTYAGDGPLNTDLSARIVFDAPKHTYVAEAQHPPQVLATLMPHRRSWPDTMLGDISDAEMTRLRQELAPYEAAITQLLQAEIARVSALPRPPSDAVIEQLLKAYELAPQCAAVRGALFVLVQQQATLQDKILSGMWAITPNDRRIASTYLAYLNRIKDAQRAQAVRNALSRSQ